MNNRIKSNLIKYLREEKGQALIAVLALLLLGSLTLPPILALIGTSLKTDKVYRDRANELYAADSGVEDAIWQIKYDRLEILFGDPNYAYNFGTNCSYELEDLINGLTTEVTIQNVWIPSNVTPPGDPAEAKEIIESNKLMVAGTAIDDTNYKIKINFYPAEGEEDDLLVKSLGIWLPYGFSYVDGSSNLEQADYGEAYYSDPTVSPHAGGQAVVWEFSSANLTYFPGVELSGNPQSTEVTFEYTANETGARPATISWIETEGNVTDILPTTWDVDTRIYRVTSVANDTEIEAYATRCELRKMEAAIAGDYKAIGNSLMTDDDNDNYREHWHSESSTTVSDIPNNAEDEFADVVAAYLYWSGWSAEGTLQPILEDDCSNFGNWISGSCWNINLEHFRSHYSSGEESTRYLTLKNSLDLSAYAFPMATVSWEHWEQGNLSSSDALKFQFSGDDGESWGNLITAFANDIGSSPKSFSYTIPEEYLTDEFKMRFYLQGFGDNGDYCHIDNFAVAEVLLTSVCDDTAVFKIDDFQVYLDGDGNPQTGTQDITASKTQVLPNYNSDGSPNGFSYACYLDVTKLVKEYAEVVDDEYGKEHHIGNAKYTVGDVAADTDNMWSYAGWSLIIIYSHPKTAGHQLYLYDDFIYANNNTNIDFDGDGSPGGDITGFVVPEQIGEEPNAAKLTCFVGEGDNKYTGDSLEFKGQSGFSEFLSNAVSPWSNVWNSQSPGMSYDGVDIDTFDVPWKNGLNQNLVEPGDTSAHINLQTSIDSWNLIYMILSMHSETITGGTVHYVIRSN